MFLALILLPLAACESSPSSDAIDAVRGEVRDSPSALFRDVRACPSGRGYYGQVDSKDEGGRFEGYRGFVYVEGDVGLQDDPARYAEIRKGCVTPAR